jgi:3-hydroxyacyl-CoA dehydrogenase/enoyl-CoA hydratase/3-hydroxybutyryl-CoA epimerase
MHVVFTSPILEERVLEELIAVFQQDAGGDPAKPLVLRSAHPTVFLAGAHLAEIASLDEASCAPYAERGRKAVSLLESYPAPTVAAVCGSCSGGGFDLVLASDMIITWPSARFEHPGVKRGLVTGWSGTTVLPGVVGGPLSRAALLTGRTISGQFLKALSARCSVDDNPTETATDAALDLARLGSARLQLWRSLRRGRFVDRFRASVLHKL